MPHSIKHQTRLITDLSELEASLRAGLLDAWEKLMEQDPVSNFFQGTLWCMEWYRSYQEDFRSLVMLVERDETLIGLVPLAIEKSTGRLTFAGDNMSDYRDVVAASGCREIVVGELLSLHRSGQFPNPLRIGPTQPESETLQTTKYLSQQSGVRAIARYHPCWRLWFSENTSTKKLTSKESIRRNISYYKRKGELKLERIETAEAWDAMKQEFFDQHSLRQLQAGRPISFNDPRKRAFHDALLCAGGSASIQISALRVGGRLIAAHYGYIWRGVLYWGAPAFDVREEKHSPGQILLAFLIQEAQASGLRGVDFTLGTEEFKKRFGNSCVELPSIEIYSKTGKYFARKFRDQIVAGAKSATTRMASAERWEIATESSKTIFRRMQRAYRIGLLPSLARALQGGTKVLLEKRKGLIFIALPEDVRPVAPALMTGETCSFHNDEVGDLLRWDGDEHATACEIETTVKGAAGSFRRGHRLHTILINERLAGWGWSYQPLEPAFITETQTTLEFEPHSVSLYGFYVAPEYRGRKLYQALLSKILDERFTEGVQRAYIMCLETNVASRKAIERTGFRLFLIQDFSRLLWQKRWQQHKI